MDEEKNTSSTRARHYEEQPLEVAASEYEPPTEYRIHWRTMAAVFSLAMGNVCAAMSNTVGLGMIVLDSAGGDHFLLTKLSFQSNTTIRSQIDSLGDASLSSWIANANFLVTLAFGPVFVSTASLLKTFCISCIPRY